MLAAAAATVVVASLSKGVAAAKCSQTCYYEVTADMSWTAESHPTDFPDGPEHFSPLWTVAHDDTFTFWTRGGISNPGIQQIAETGMGSIFMEEVEACGASCGVGAGFECTPMSGVCQAKGEVKVTGAYPYLSVATMVAPSPDWFTGFTSLNLCENGEWLETYTRDLFAYDAGTDSGESFLSEDAPTTPFEPISAFNTITPPADSIFYNPAQGVELPLGKIQVVRVRCDGDDMMADGDDVMVPKEMEIVPEMEAAVVEEPAMKPPAAVSPSKDGEGMTVATGGVPCSQTCYYEVTAEMRWTAESHPSDFPDGPDHFSPLWTVAHDDTFTFWTRGEISNPGIQQIAESGMGSIFMEEVEACGASCGVGAGFECTPMSGQCNANGEVRMVAAYPYLSTATMVAPSPDWFTGFNSLNLCVDGMWLESYTRELIAYDAGTDSGESFLSEDAPTTPFEPISAFNTITPPADSIFYNPAQGAELPLGTVNVVRVRCENGVMPAGAAIPVPAVESVPEKKQEAAATAMQVTAAAGACGMGGQPVCSGAQLVGRNQCDFGYVGEDGMCVRYVPRSEREAIPSDVACGGNGDPVCAGDALNGREYECDFGYVGQDDICVPYSAMKVDSAAGKSGSEKEGKMQRKARMMM